MNNEHKDLEHEIEYVRCPAVHLCLYESYQCGTGDIDYMDCSHFQKFETELRKRKYHKFREKF